MDVNLLLEIILSGCYGVIVLTIIQKIFLGRIYRGPFISFLIYTLLSICYYWINITIVPEYKGFTGGLHIGTDDCSFFAQIVDVKFSLPMTCDDLFEYHNYSRFMDFIYPFTVRTPLPILVFNCVGIACIPILGKKIYADFFPDAKNNVIIYLIFFLSPMILMNGLILIRDGWSTQFFMFFIYNVIKKRKIAIILFSAFLVAVFRPTFVIFPILFYVIERNFDKPNFYFRMGAASIAILPLAFYILKVNKGVDLTEGLVRQDYVSGFLGQFGEESILYRIMTMPFPLNIILSFLFFLTSPFLKWGFVYEGTFVMRKLFTFFEAVVMTILIPGFLVNFVHNWKNNPVFKRLSFFVILSILLLSTISMQARHKMIVLPLIYILFVYSSERNKKLIFPLAIIYGIFQLLI
ncbi:hypothetical protein [Sphingobacterium prati]|uniref:hypothetical protein n=1 Tax=Sphingobacterium prati TaxID=2737006 RepID=UPI001554603D|nr:hypothetical protein [Sphingobacterium prati]NPE45874.1 hypothetical protein [Sphingobacterium prati]